MNLSAIKLITPWMLLPLLCLASTSSHAVEMLYAVYHPSLVARTVYRPDTTYMEILGYDPVTRAQRVVYSDRGQPISLGVDISEGDRVIATTASGRLYACAHVRPAVGGTCIGNPDHGSAPAIYELSLDGTHRARRLFSPAGDQFVRHFAANPAGTLLAYANRENSRSDPPGTYSLFVRRTTDGVLAHRINLSAICIDCFVTHLSWLDNEHLVFVFMDNEATPSSPDSAQKSGIYRVRLDGSGLVRLHSSLVTGHRDAPHIQQVYSMSAGGERLMLVGLGWIPATDKRFNDQRNVLFRTDTTLHTRDPMYLTNERGARDVRPDPTGRWIAFQRSLTVYDPKPPWKYYTDIFLKDAESGSEWRVAATEPSALNPTTKIVLIGWRTAP